MKPRLALLVLVSSSALSAEPAAVQTLEAVRFKTLAAEKKGLVLDVRTPGEVAHGKVAGASVIDIFDPKFQQKLALLPRSRPVFVYCASGARSAQAAQTMHELGFSEVYNLAGGVRSWTGAGLPLEEPAPTAATALGLDPRALDALLKAEKRVLVDYQTPWCTPCQKMAPVVDAFAEATKGKVKVLKVDVDASEALAAREKIEGVPVFVLYVDGKERRRGSGELTQEALRKLALEP